MTFGIIIPDILLHLFATEKQYPVVDFNDLFGVHAGPLGLLLPLATSSATALSRSDPEPMAITTAAFPDRHNNASRRKFTATTRPYPKGDCTICLETLSTGSLVVLPCRHMLHRRCLCALSGNPTTGASSMVRCPCCRQSIDRYDLLTLGFRSRPSQVIESARRCHCIRTLSISPDPLEQRRMYNMDRIARLILRCRNTIASDGLVYNVSVLAIERAIHSRRLLVRSISAQLRDCRPDTEVETIKTIVACHVEVLMRSGGIMQTEI